MHSLTVGDDAKPMAATTSEGGNRRRLTVLLVLAVSVLVPGAAHLRLGALSGGIAYMGSAAALTAVQVLAPLVDAHAAQAALVSGTAFALGWVVSAHAARSASRLVA
jgi:hypothetical protein